MCQECDQREGDMIQAEYQAVVERLATFTRLEDVELQEIEERYEAALPASVNEDIQAFQAFDERVMLYVGLLLAEVKRLRLKTGET